MDEQKAATKKIRNRSAKTRVKHPDALYPGGKPRMYCFNGSGHRRDARRKPPITLATHA